jgi:hypothetical protein
MPDDFDNIPDSTRFDTSPSGVSVPASGISDYPAHVAVINQDWLPLLLGLIDRGGYSNVWKDADDEVYAFRQINELQASLMTTLYDGPFEGAKDTFSLWQNQLNLPAGNPTLTLFTVPTNHVYKLTHISFRMNSTTINRVALQFIQSGVQLYVFEVASPTNFQTYQWHGELWFKVNRSLTMAIVNATSGDDMNVICSGLDYTL